MAELTALYTVNSAIVYIAKVLLFRTKQTGA